VKLFDVLLGRPSPLNPTSTTCRAPWCSDHPGGIDGPAPTGQAGVCFKPATGQQFADTASEVEQLLDLGENTKIHDESDSYGYRWAVITDDDFGDLINEVHIVNTTLQDHGWGPQLLCSVFGFAPIPGVQAIPPPRQARRRWRAPTWCTCTSGAPSTPSYAAGRGAARLGARAAAEGNAGSGPLDGARTRTLVSPLGTARALTAPVWPGQWRCPAAQRGWLSSGVDVHEYGRVIRRRPVAPHPFSCLSIDERIADPARERPGDEHEVDAHPAALVEVACAVVPPRVETINLG